jgi:prophage antirepressor-like protein
MSTMIPFEFNSNAIRVIEIDGEPWFVGKDVAEALGYADPTNAIKQHCKGVVKRHPLQTAGGRQKVRVLNEPDVLRLMISSTLPAAQEFEALVFEVILPTIRKTGQYSAAPKTITPEKELELARELINLQHRLLKAQAELEDFHRQVEAGNVAERLINQGVRRNIIPILWLGASNPQAGD